MTSGQLSSFLAATQISNGRKADLSYFVIQPALNCQTALFEKALGFARLS